MSVLDYSARDYLGTRLHTAQSYGPSSEVLEEEVDVVVVGAGPSGLVSAMVLAEAGAKVVVVEAGQFWEHESFERRQSWAARYLMQEQATRIMTGNAFIPLASGKGVGGGTLVNSAICFRAPDWVLDEWVEEWGIDYFDEDRREALFEEVEEAIGVAPTPANVAGGNSEIARRGFRALGLEHGYMPRNAPGCVGCGTCQTGCPVGGKATADLTWLPRYLAAGGVLYADTKAQEVEVDAQGRARGIAATMSDPYSGEEVATMRWSADRVILAAGAVHTPMLMLRQDLGNDSGQVGRHLRVHPTCAVVARFPDEEVKLWSGATQGYYAKHPEHREILLETFSTSPDLFLAQLGGVGEIDAGEFLRNFKHIAAAGLLIRDSSSGRVRPSGDGTASISYRLNRRDVQKIRSGLYLLARMFYEAGSRAIRPMVRGSRYFAHHRTARAHIAGTNRPSRLSLYASHPHGTCRMGADEGRAVVRPEDGGVYGVDGLHIVDSSIFPTALGANPQVTIMAQALALGRRIAEL